MQVLEREEQTTVTRERRQQTQDSFAPDRRWNRSHTRTGGSGHPRWQHRSNRREPRRQGDVARHEIQPNTPEERLGEGSIGRAVGARHGSSTEDRNASDRRQLSRFPHQPGLAQPRVAGDDDQAAATGPCTLEPIVEHAELAGTTNQHRASDGGHKPKSALPDQTPT